MLSLIEYMLIEAVSRNEPTNKLLASLGLTPYKIRNRDLSGANLAKADLTKVDLSEANLTGTNFTRANCTGADFAGADLNRANFTEAIGIAKEMFKDAKNVDKAIGVSHLFKTTNADRVKFSLAENLYLLLVGVLLIMGVYVFIKNFGQFYSAFGFLGTCLIGIFMLVTAIVFGRNRH